MRKYGRAVAEIELEAVGGGMLDRTLMPVLSVSRKRPPYKLPPGIKETADPAVTATGAASPLLAISLRRPSSSETLPRLAARPRWWPPDNRQPHGLLRGEMPAYELPRGPRPAGAASISRSL
jgi:hypothetical protein